MLIFLQGLCPADTQGKHNINKTENMITGYRLIKYTDVELHYFFRIVNIYTQISIYQLIKEVHYVNL